MTRPLNSVISQMLERKNNAATRMCPKHNKPLTGQWDSKAICQQCAEELIENAPKCRCGSPIGVGQDCMCEGEP